MMDKSRMNKSRVSIEYTEGAKRFIELAIQRGTIINGMLKCACVKCNNVLYQNKETTFEHLVCNGIIREYTEWFHHGEPPSSQIGSSSRENFSGANVDDRGDGMHAMVHDAFGVEYPVHGDNPYQGRDDIPREHASKFFRLVEEAEKEFYPGCKTHTKLSSILRLWHIKCLGGWSNNSFTLLLEYLWEVLPEGHTLPKTFAQAKKIISELGLGYNKIEACPRGCMLFWKNDINKQSCDYCHASRYKTRKGKVVDDEKKTPAKVLRHFPLKPRLQRLFMSSKTASTMRWHDEERKRDGIVRHPADSRAWKHLDNVYPTFASDPRNVRLGLASDGFNPFRTMSLGHSTWPVILTPYNLPPWLCMKQPNLILSLLIPGKKGPGDYIDTYLQPLIEELQDLWKFGVETYDASKKETFKLHAALLWTISDFPGYAMLSGWSTKGKLACPICLEGTCYRYLHHSQKGCYMGHRRFLPMDHTFRRQKHSFDDTIEKRQAPISLSGSVILHKIKSIEHTFQKPWQRKRARSTNDEKTGWKKKSIFFDLPYWEHNLLRHCLDVMHIEKNVCDNIIMTLINDKNKSKDTLSARLDLVDMKIRKELHPQWRNSGRVAYLPPASYTMTKNEKRMFCKVLENLKIPSGFSSNISRCVNVEDHKIFGLKSHDSHVIMQQLLPLAIRRTLPKNVKYDLLKLSNFFHKLCSKEWQTNDFKCLNEGIAEILCHLERIFPPAFFDVMEHLPIHLASEALLGGPVQFRWMYPIERYLYTLKSYVRNRAQPEASIAEGYIAEECLSFCSRYFNNAESRYNRTLRTQGEAEAKGRTRFLLTEIELMQAHRYVLFNNERLVGPYMGRHQDVLCLRFPSARPHQIQKMHNEQFIDWFKNEVRREMKAKVSIEAGVDMLAQGPNRIANRFTSYTTNEGYTFRIFDKDQRAQTQNSGIAVVAETISYASARDKSPISGALTYYGRVIDIVEMIYSDVLHFILFKCDWVDIRAQNKGIKIDEHGFTLVNFSRRLFSGQGVTDEPYVLASQAKQVFYVEDPIEPEWSIAIKVKPKDMFNVADELVLELPLHEQPPNDVDIEYADVSWLRQSGEGEIVIVNQEEFVGQEVHLAAITKEDDLD